MEDPGRYGRSFAEVYDRWYPGGDEAAVIEHIRALVPAGARVLELGAGTGRLALALAAAGHRVVALDSSPEMLAQLAAKPGAEAVERVLADAGDPDGWPAGPFDLVLAACNLLLNLPSAEAQARCVQAAAGALGDSGRLVVELSNLDVAGAGRGLEVRSVDDHEVVLIATDADPATGVVRGAHVELRDGESVRLRPWSVRAVGLDELDRWCAAAGLELDERSTGWGPPESPATPGVTVSTYTRR